MIIRAFSISQFQFDGAQLIPHRLARVFCTGIIPGLLWKKIDRYTVINYNDGYMDQVIVLDFHKDVERVQTGLYQNMIDTKKGNEQNASI
jgi:hypothetical protein